MPTQAWPTRFKKWLPGLLTLFGLLATTLTPLDAHAFFTTLAYKTQDKGNREILSFMIPPGASPPHLKMIDPVTMQLIVPGVLALPSTQLNLNTSKWIKSLEMADAPSGEEMGLQLTLGFKDPNLNFRDSVGEYDPIDGALFQLEIDPPIIPSGAGPAQLLEGRVMAGRDGTLLILTHTGNGFLEPKLDLGGHVIHLDWQGATLAPTWRPVVPAGLAEKINTYEFKGKIEMEINLHESVGIVKFLKDPASGIFIASLHSKDGLGRLEDAEKILAERRQAVAEKQPQPLRRIGTATYIVYPENKITLNHKEIDELYYLNKAKDAERDHHYAKARGFIDRLLSLFPLTKNREYLDFYKLDLAHNLKWKSGWLLEELNTVLARYPNTGDYSNLRLMQLQLLNKSHQYQEASSIMFDPNLPRDNHLVWLERGRATMGLANSKIATNENLASGEEFLNKVVKFTRNQGPSAAEAQFLLAQLSMGRGDNEGAIKILDAMDPTQKSYIANKPERLMETADIYYKFRRYPDAVNLYTQVLSHYPTHPAITPWAMLRLAESNRQLNHVEDATRLFDRLKKDYASSDAAVWGMIFQLQLDKDRDNNERLNELARIMRAMALPKDQADSFMSKVKILLSETNRHWDVKKTLDQLTALKKDYPKITPTVWEQIPALQEKMEQNFKDRLTRLNQIIHDIALPEALAEAYMTKAEMLGEAGRHKEVLETLNQLLTISSHNSMITRAKEFKRHYLLEGMGKALDDGRPEYAAILGEIYGEDWREDPAFIPARIHMGEAMLRLGMNEAALKFLDGIQTDSANSLTQLANALTKGAILELPAKNSDNNTNTSSANVITPNAARVRLDEAARQALKQDWESVLLILDSVPEALFNPNDRIERWRILAKAEAGLERFPQAVQHMEDLLFDQAMGDGIDYYWYACILHKWKGDTKALPAFQRVAAEAKNKEIQALARIRIGDILQRSGDYKAAKEQFSEVKTLAPASPWSRISDENAAQLGMALDVNP